VASVDAISLSRTQFVGTSGKLLFVGSSSLAADTSAAGATYVWTVLSRPASSQSSLLTGTTNLAPVFTPDASGRYELRVSGACMASVCPVDVSSII